MHFRGGDHLLDVDVGVFTSVLFEFDEELVDEVGQIVLLALGVLDLVAEVQVAGQLLHEVHEELALVGHEGLADLRAALDHAHPLLDGEHDDLGVLAGERLLEGGDQLGQDVNDLVRTHLGQQQVDAAVALDVLGVLLHDEALE
eukprot:CAMPEP_0116913036 /NCGR_PEP_ID=MMETSP0467-20121206/16458_1 /TAXON_ID=283647 /ORGANISM="Mesodinium pulex, Strain SPMC105" /LENGTH=143 /DNA_ID=CAMNT_0004589161 /DNA_START=177 /DNA_END=609 /DNA_ORIENTATION=-